MDKNSPLIILLSHLNIHRITAVVIAIFVTAVTYAMFKYTGFLSIPMFFLAVLAYDAMYKGFKSYRYIMAGIASFCFGAIALFIGGFLNEGSHRSIGAIPIIIAGLVTFAGAFFMHYREFKRRLAEDEEVEIEFSKDNLGKIILAVSSALFFIFSIYFVIHFNFM